MRKLIEIGNSIGIPGDPDINEVVMNHQRLSDKVKYLKLKMFIVVIFGIIGFIVPVYLFGIEGVILAMASCAVSMMFGVSLFQLY